MIGPEFLSTFRLKPIRTIQDWENARRWKVYFESQLDCSDFGINKELVTSLAIVSNFLDSSRCDSLDSSEYDFLDSTGRESSDSSECDFLDSPKRESLNSIGRESSELSGSIKHLGTRIGSSPSSKSVSPDFSATPSLDQTQLLPATLTMELTIEEVINLLGILTDHFDRYHWFTEAGDLMKEIRVRMRRQGCKNKDLVEEIGSKGYVSDILNRRKPLTMRTARVFRDFFDIPADWLLSDYLDEKAFE